MSFDYWIAAERWYEGAAGIVFGGMIFVLFVMCIALTKRKTKGGKIFLSTGAVIASILLGILLMNNQRYEDYLEPAGHVTPAIRRKEYKMFQGYQPILRSEQDFYARYHDPTGVAATGLYEKEVVSIPVTYLGKSGRHYFFEHEGEVFRQYENSVRFDPEAEETLLMGSLFHLMDRQYESIGFVDTEYIFYEQIVIAGEDDGKMYDPGDEGLIPNTKEAFFKWTFPYY